MKESTRDKNFIWKEQIPQRGSAELSWGCAFANVTSVPFEHMMSAWEVWQPFHLTFYAAHCWCYEIYITLENQSWSQFALWEEVDFLSKEHCFILPRHRTSSFCQAEGAVREQLVILNILMIQKKNIIVPYRHNAYIQILNAQTSERWLLEIHHTCRIRKYFVNG